jgi:hypothetical protein
LEKVSQALSYLKIKQKRRWLDKEPWFFEVDDGRMK